MSQEHTNSVRTAFFHDERCLWHGTAGLFSLFFPVGRWVQPPAGAGLADSPESKGRFLFLLLVSSVAAKIDIRSALMATEEDLLRVHPHPYLQQFKALSVPARVFPSKRTFTSPS